MANRVTESFKVVSVSKNSNSFGLKGVILMARDGEAWEVGASHINIPVKGERIQVALDLDNPSISPLFAEKGFEIPRRLPGPPEQVVREVWK